jgi:hypothetical protein
MCRKIMLKYTNKLITLIFIAGMLLLPAISFADGGPPPCDDNDIFTPCPVPLDTWVWVLAIAALAFGAVYLYRQQKNQKAI